MLINEVCGICKITKKAVAYYESRGFLRPETSENGYRRYSDRDIAMLREISMLRRLDIPIADIKEIVLNPDRCGALTGYRAKRAEQLERARAQCDCIDRLIADGYDVEQAIGDIERTLDHNSNLRDRLRCAFPGNYGRFISLHFGRFLTATLDTAEQWTAYRGIVDFLDSLEGFRVSPELAQVLETVDRTLDAIDLGSIGTAMAAAAEDFDRYIERNQEEIERYIAYRSSDQYRSGPACEMQKLLRDFHRSSGYYDLFIPNLERLSPAYAEYRQKMRTANDRLIERFPEAESFC